jgi:hypothetical protein
MEIGQLKTMVKGKEQFFTKINLKTLIFNLTLELIPTMKTKLSSLNFAVLCTIAFLAVSCGQNKKLTDAPVKIENTLKSVSLVYDSLGTEPSEVLSMFEGMNEAIDSLGYPDAGYKVWIVKGDSTAKFRFMIEGHWPNMAVYDSIHKSKIYKDAGQRLGPKFWKGKKSISYNRFTLVK